MPVETLFAVKVLHDVMIPMPDGVRLAGNLFLPEEPGQYPGILSFTPYLKDGYGGHSHAPHHRHFASRGYAVMQVDFRGTGSSEGTNPHPFDTQEREDGYQIVEWMAAQPWCTGSVGIWGISYGGITSLSIASTQPPHLKAIVPIHATIDNYEWLHRTHGCRGLLLGDVDWGTRMVVSNLLPPVRQDTEGRWARLWAERLEANKPWFLDWHGCPPDPDFWLRRRIPYERINVPTFGICGWYDAYTAPTFTVYEAVQAPKRVLIGPWKHALADLSPMTPIGGVHEMDRWWDRWLKGIDNGVEHEPPVAIYVMGDDEWRHETEWPIARTDHRRFQPQPDHGFSEDQPSIAADAYDYDARVGTGSIGYNGHRLNLPIPTDQAADDHLSLTYTAAPLTEDTEITGAPIAHLTISADTDELTLVAKLCVVAPNGASRVISQGNRNPARLDGHAAKQPLTEGELRTVEIPMHPTSTVVPAGHRLRLCIAGADFPDLWPTPRLYKINIHRGGENGSWIDIPVVPKRPDPLPAPNLQPARTDLHAPDSSGDIDLHVVHHHLGTRAAGFETRRTSRHHVDTDTILTGDHHSEVTTDADRPWTTNLRADSRFELLRPFGSISARVQSLLTPFALQATAEIDVDGQPFFRRTWTKTIDDWTS